MTSPCLSPRSRLSRLLLALSFFACCSPLLPADAAPPGATLVIGGKTVPFVVPPFVGSDGQVEAPVDAVRLLGASFTPNRDDRTVTVTAQNDKTVTVPYSFVQDRYFVPIQKVAVALGADADWQPTTRVLTLRARMEMVRQEADSLSIFTSYPVYYSVRQLDSPRRLYVDLYGLDLAAAPARIPTTSDNVARIRSGQLDFNTVRIVIDLRKSIAFRVASPLQASRVQVALADGPARPGPAQGTLAPLPVRPPAVAARPRPVLPPVSPAAGIRITGISCKAVSDGVTQVAISTTGAAKYRTETLDNPNRIAFDLAGATFEEDVKPLLTADSPIIKAIRSGILQAGQTQFGRIVLDLTRLVGFTITTEDNGGGTTYLINLQTPRTASGTGANSLVGKVVVVDPGHGAADTGAIGIGGVREKTINLAIGKKLRDVLTANGARVFMTREEDSGFLEVGARPKFAIAHDADYFISVHCDESGPRNSHSGSTVYYHAHNALCRRFAMDVLNRIADVSGIPAAGIRSDMVRFQTGFGVLRGSPMPAILVECGYMNNARDLAKLLTQETQQHIAEGIVAGLRDFIADRAAR